MILLDLSQILYSTILASLKEFELSESAVRHITLNTIRANKVKFSPQYGELVICMDSSGYWREDLFPYYKAMRKVKKKESLLDWDAMHSIMSTITTELDQTFPYRFVRCPKTEADDVIAVLAREFGSRPDSSEKVLIISADHDFIQLQQHTQNIVQYDPIRKKWVDHPNPSAYLEEHIIRGDRGDGIPNIRSQDDSFVSGTRQKKIMSAQIEGWVESAPADYCTGEMLRNYHRNKQLIDLSMIPTSISEPILIKYHEQSNKKKASLFDYFVKNKLNNLMTNISDF